MKNVIKTWLLSLMIMSCAGQSYGMQSYGMDPREGKISRPIDPQHPQYLQNQQHPQYLQNQQHQQHQQIPQHQQYLQNQPYSIQQYQQIPQHQQHLQHQQHPQNPQNLQNRQMNGVTGDIEKSYHEKINKIGNLTQDLVSGFEILMASAERDKTILSRDQKILMDDVERNKRTLSRDQETIAQLNNKISRDQETIARSNNKIEQLKALAEKNKKINISNEKIFRGKESALNDCILELNKCTESNRQLLIECNNLKYENTVLNSKLDELRNIIDRQLLNNTKQVWGDRSSEKDIQNQQSEKEASAKQRSESEIKTKIMKLENLDRREPSTALEQKIVNQNSEQNAEEVAEQSVNQNAEQIVNQNAEVVAEQNAEKESGE